MRLRRLELFLMVSSSSSWTRQGHSPQHAALRCWEDTAARNALVAAGCVTLVEVSIWCLLVHMKLRTGRVLGNMVVLSAELVSSCGATQRCRAPATRRSIVPHSQIYYTSARRSSDSRQLLVGTAHSGALHKASVLPAEPCSPAGPCIEVL